MKYRWRVLLACVILGVAHTALSTNPATPAKVLFTAYFLTVCVCAIGGFALGLFIDLYVA